MGLVCFFYRDVIWPKWAVYSTFTITTNQKMQTFLKKFWPAALFGILIFASFQNIYFEDAFKFQSKAAKEIVVTTVVVAEIETLVLPLTESIPVLKGWANSYQNDFDKLLNYLEAASLMIGLQLTLLALSKSMVLKWLAVILLLGLFLEKTKARVLPLLLLVLMINPGLSLYTKLMEATVVQSHFNLGGDLQKHLNATKDSIQGKHAIHQAKLDSLKARQMAAHGGKLTLVNKVEGAFIKDKNELTDDIDKIGRDIIDVLRFAGKHSIQLAINMIINIIIVFVLMPLLFWFVFAQIIKRLFRTNSIKPITSGTTLNPKKQTL